MANGIERSEIEDLVKVAVLANDVEWIKKNMATREDLARVEGRLAEGLAKIVGEMASMESRLTRKFVGWFIGAAFIMALYGALIYFVAVR
ncbi:MAG: hypothetical protein ACUVXI_13950 [bacterium]